MSYNIFNDSHKYRPKIKTLLLEDEGFLDIALIEGNKETLIFLSDLIRALANDDTQDKVSISPDGAGNAYFSKDVKLGIYIKKT